MACWKDLFAYLKDEQMQPHEIIERLGVYPSRLRKMLNSKRLATALSMLHSLAERQAGAIVGRSAAIAARKLKLLTAAAQAESTRKACNDVMEKAQQALRDEESRLYKPVPRFLRR